MWPFSFIKGKPSIKRRVDAIPAGTQDAKPFRCACRLLQLYESEEKKGGMPTAELIMVEAYKKTLIQYDHPAPKNLKEAKQLVKYLEVK